MSFQIGVSVDGPQVWEQVRDKNMIVGYSLDVIFKSHTYFNSTRKSYLIFSKFKSRSRRQTSIPGRSFMLLLWTSNSVSVLQYQKSFLCSKYYHMNFREMTRRLGWQRCVYFKSRKYKIKRRQLGKSATAIKKHKQ